MPLSPARPSPRQEGWVPRALRWAGDRRHLAELDDRLLRDVGLTRADLAHGTPFAPVPPFRAGGCPSDSRTGPCYPAAPNQT